ncbi:hypothetical protein BDP27DRAFT_1423349 [Rhodocollybia butyracea]|uniref:F-box domain-containing protein n=1 Tax=Rhodocollybia butyracea TaxID=206335 RepID=A0A9P5PQV9_9AGAR|nr:hypothetical protein BDP27DRAFT_1423349 [Rhodocollybia butyracea]
MPLCSSCGGNSFIPRVVVDSPGLQLKLRTESGPASVQPDEVASVLRNIERDLEDYEAEISRLGQEKERLEHYAAQLWSRNSPLRNVPNEILQHIFDDCCDMNSFRVVNLEDRLPMHTSQALSSKPAMVISSVCSRWRRNALSMPVIWSRISLYWNRYDNWENEDMEIFFPLSNFLSRSQQHPLTIILEVDADPFIYQRRLHPLLEHLFGQIGRWQELSFTCSRFTFEYLLGCSVMTQI